MMGGTSWWQKTATTEIELYKRAFQRLGISDVTFTRDGVETIEHLSGGGKFGDREKYPFPQWLLTDLKMPRVDGIDVLKWMQENPAYRVVPTIMLSNSNQIKDITRAYELGVNAFFTKPTRLQELIDTLALINHFWSIAQRPPQSRNSPDLRGIAILKNAISAQVPNNQQLKF